MSRSDANETSGTIAPEVIGRTIETFVKPEPDDYGVIVLRQSTWSIGLMDATVNVVMFRSVSSTISPV